MKNIATIVLSAAVMFGLCAAGLLLPDAEMSSAERRLLAEPPELSWESVFSGRFMKAYEDYLPDRFPLRDGFRSLKAVTQFYAFGQKDNNRLYSVGDGLYKLEYPLDTDQVLTGAAKLNALYDRYFAGMNVYYSIIPDKNYFAAAQNGYPSMDYENLVSLMRDNVKHMRYLDIFDCLTLGDYYRTDIHWRQERIYPAALRLAQGMNAADGFAPFEAYTPNTLSPFYGVYYGQLALPVAPEELVYMTCPAVDGAVVTSAEIAGEFGVYEPDKFNGVDGYDVFLSGAQAIVTIECGGPADRELIIFRDSFGSGIAPYFIGAYSKITLIDLRYVVGDVLPRFVDFAEQDVLFLYSTVLLNSSTLLR